MLSFIVQDKIEIQFCSSIADIIRFNWDIMAQLHRFVCEAKTKLHHGSQGGREGHGISLVNTSGSQTVSSSLSNVTFS